MESLRTWLADNPKSRPLLMLGLGALLLGLFWGVILVKQKKHGTFHPGSESTEITAADVTDDVPSITGGPAAEQYGESPRPPKAAWIRDKGAAARPQPGLNIPPSRTLKAWQEVSWVREENQWDQIRMLDGAELWVQSKDIAFVRPSSGTQKPTDAELAVVSFYQALSRHDYSEAYKYLSPEWKSDLDFDHFVRGYSRSESLRSEIVRVVPLATDRCQVDVKVLSQELGVKTAYIGFYTVEKKGDHWQMASGELNKTADATFGTPEAAAVAPAPPPPASALTPEPEPSPTTPASRELIPAPTGSITPDAPTATPTPQAADTPGGDF